MQLEPEVWRCDRCPEIVFSHKLPRGWSSSNDGYESWCEQCTKRLMRYAQYRAEVKDRERMHLELYRRMR